MFTFTFQVDLTTSEGSKEKLPLILDGAFFCVTSSGANQHVTAKCKSCQSKLQGRSTSTSNFVAHLKKKHPIKYDEFMTYKRSGVHGGRAHVGNNYEAPPTEMNVVVSTKPAPPMFEGSWQKLADQLVTRTIVSASLAIRLVEISDMQEMVKQLSMMPVAVHCPSPYVVKKNIDDHYSRMKAIIVKRMETTAYVCTTADMWSSRRRSYLGMTLHWLNTRFERESFAIACQRFYGKHDYLNIGKAINQVHERYGLGTDKIICTVTDNAANMIKCFREHQIHVALEDVNNDNEIPPEAVPEGENDPEEEDYESIIIDDFPEMPGIQLPPHVRCAAHTFNLIATTDIDKAVKEKKLCEPNYSSTMQLLSKHWNHMKRSPKSSEAF